MRLRIRQLFDALGRSLYQVRRVMGTGVEKVRVGWVGGFIDSSLKRAGLLFTMFVV